MRTRLGGAAGIVGRKILINNYPMTIVGVAAPGFRGTDWSEVPSLWIPAMMKRQSTPEFDWLRDRRGRWLHVFARLKPGISPEQAQTGLQPWFKAMLEADTKREGWPQVTEERRRRFLASTLTLLPAARGRSNMRAGLRTPLIVLLSATGLILLLACLNVAGLCLARGFARQRETALRLALGVLLAPSVTRSLISFLPENVDLSGAINPRMLLFTMAMALLTGLLFGLAPAIRASGAAPGLELKEQSASVTGGIELRKIVVTAQIALALILLIGAGLFVRTLASLRGKGPGFATTNLLMFRLDPSRNGYSREQSKTILVNALAGLRNLPEVESAGGDGDHTQRRQLEPVVDPRLRTTLRYRDRPLQCRKSGLLCDARRADSWRA